RSVRSVRLGNRAVVAEIAHGPNDDGRRPRERLAGVGRPTRIAVREVHATVQAGVLAFLQDQAGRLERVGWRHTDGVESGGGAYRPEIVDYGGQIWGRHGGTMLAPSAAVSLSERGVVARGAPLAIGQRVPAAPVGAWLAGAESLTLAVAELDRRLARPG